MLRDAGKRLAPGLINDDRADWSIQAAAFRTVFAPMPGRVDRANEINTGIQVRRQDGGHLSITNCVVGHLATVAGLRG